MAITKLCAMHEIGPDVHTTIPYDLILYEDALQFHLERCESMYDLRDYAYSTLAKHNPNKVKDDLVRCLWVLHRLHIVHRDIKPSNILYCKRLDRFVLCDFGISEYVKENIGEVSATTYAGTLRFIGPEVEKLKYDKTAKVDLYYNDVFACIVLLEMLVTSVDRQRRR